MYILQPYTVNFNYSGPRKFIIITTRVFAAQLLLFATLVSCVSPVDVLHQPAKPSNHHQILISLQSYCKTTPHHGGT